MTQLSLVGKAADYSIDVDGDSDFRFAWNEDTTIWEDPKPAPSPRKNLSNRFDNQVAYGKANGNSSVGFRTRWAVKFRQPV